MKLIYIDKNMHFDIAFSPISWLLLKDIFMHYWPQHDHLNLF